MAKTIYLPDYGIHPDTGVDCSAALQSVFDSIVYDGEPLSVQFKKGTYRISRALSIRGAKNLTILGGTSTVLAHFDPTAPISANNDVFHFYDSDDVTVSDFFFDTDNPIGAAGRITAINRDAGTAD